MRREIVRKEIRIASAITFLVGAVALANPHVTAPGQWAAIWASTLMGVALMLFAAIHFAGARRGSPLFGARLMSIYTMTVAALLLYHGFLLRLPPTYAWTAGVLGAIVLVVEGFDAIVSPGSRWRRANPRA